MSLLVVSHLSTVYEWRNASQATGPGKIKTGFEAVKWHSIIE